MFHIYYFLRDDYFLVSKEMFNNLGDWLCTITGFDSFSLQPNAGAAGEYAGLMVIRAYHKVNGRQLCLQTMLLSLVAKKVGVNTSRHITWISFPTLSLHF